jgi:KDO2-lipid IV(A) lauroyltransferase
MKFSYYLLMAVCYPVSLLPFWVHYLFSDMLYFLIYHVGRYRVKVVRKNLASAFPEKSEMELKAIERDFYQWFCDYIVESMKLLTISKRNIKKRMVFKGTELLDPFFDNGQSIGVYLGHYCNWEWVTSLSLWISPKVQCAQIYHPIENKGVDQLFLRLRQRLGAECIPMADTLRKILELRQSGQISIIGYISDQKPNWFNIHHWVDFLHHDTPVLTGAERIMRKFNHVVFYLDVQRVRRGYYEATFKLISQEPQQLEEFKLTDIYYQLLEESIRRTPAYWLWSHNRWSRTREEFDRRFEVVNGKVVSKFTEITK